MADLGDILDAVMPLLPAIAAKENPIQAFSDLNTLYGVYKQVKTAGALDFGALRKAGLLKPAADALARTSKLFDDLENDPAQEPRVAAALATIPTIKLG